MKHPFWLINTILLAFLIIILLFIFITPSSLPRKSNFLPDSDIKLPKKEAPVKDLRKIYLNDLFDTYHATTAQPTTTSTKRETMPQPPTPQPVRVSLAPPPKFLEPLQVTLKGIIIAHDDAYNIAIIEKNAVSSNYKVGDRIDDAQLIRIMHNKIILIRSNGQQETLYVNQLDAEHDQLLLLNNNWGSIIKKITESNYAIDPHAFTKQVKSLAQLIDLLNLTTVYSKGKSIGCRIGRVGPQSLAPTLGLQPGDIILTVDDIPAVDTDQRFEIYKKIIALRIGDSFTVTFSRYQQIYSITYQLQSLTEPIQTFTVKTTPPVVGSERSVHNVEQESINILKERERFAPTAQELRMKDRSNMINYGSKYNSRSKNVLHNSIQPD